MSKEKAWEWCPFCSGSLDTGWECNDCGSDLRDYAYPKWQRWRDRTLARIRKLFHTRS